MSDAVWIGRDRSRRRSERTNRAWHALEVAGAALAADFNLQERLAEEFVVDNLHIPEFEMFGLIWAEPGIGHSEHVVVQLFSMPAIARARGGRVLARRLVEQLVLVER